MKYSRLGTSLATALLLSTIYFNHSFAYGAENMMRPTFLDLDVIGKSYRGPIPEDTNATFGDIDLSLATEEAWEKATGKEKEIPTPSKENRKFSGLFRLTFGEDSNVFMVTDQLQSNLDDQFTSALLSLNYRYAKDEKLGYHFSATRYSDHSDLDTMSHTLDYCKVGKHGRWTWELPFAFSWASLDSSSLLNYLSFRPQLAVDLGSNKLKAFIQPGMSIQVMEKREYKDLNGEEWGVVFGLEKIWESLNLRWKVAAKLSKTDVSSADLSPVETGAESKLQWLRVVKNWNTVQGFNLSYDQRDYKKSSTGREDKRMSWGVDTQWSPKKSPTWSLGAQYKNLDNRSNQVLVDYNKYNFSLFLQKQW
jgi:hypothetical protein